MQFDQAVKFQHAILLVNFSDAVSGVFVDILAFDNDVDATSGVSSIC